MVSSALKLPAWQSFRGELREAHSCIRRVEGEQSFHWLDVNIYYKKDAPEDELESILAECEEFLSGDGFLEEYLPFAYEYVSEGNEKLKQRPLPDINLRLIPAGSDAAAYTRSAMHYTTPYRSDRELTADGWQTWPDGPA